jgi:hypothetical protein
MTHCRKCDVNKKLAYDFSLNVKNEPEIEIPQVLREMRIEKIPYRRTRLIKHINIILMLNLLKR